MRVKLSLGNLSIYRIASMVARVRLIVFMLGGWLLALGLAVWACIMGVKGIAALVTGGPGAWGLLLAAALTVGKLSFGMEGFARRSEHWISMDAASADARELLCSTVGVWLLLTLLPTLFIVSMWFEDGPTFFTAWVVFGMTLPDTWAYAVLSSRTQGSVDLLESDDSSGDSRPLLVGLGIGVILLSIGPYVGILAAAARS